MATATTDRRRVDPSRDGLLHALPFLHLVVLATHPPAVVIGILMWWSANTVAHNHIHRPIPTHPGWQRARSAILSITMGVPQALWRHRHLEHHAGISRRYTHGERVQLTLESVLLTSVAVVLAWSSPEFLVLRVLPGLAIGLALCSLQGRFEHRRDRTVSHYGWLYNTLFLNDGYHVEHHRRATTHYRDLPALRKGGDSGSRWPAVLRALDRAWLNDLERGATRIAWIRRWLIKVHAAAFAELTGDLKNTRGLRVLIVGGGLFPRTATALRSVLPNAQITIMDQDSEHLLLARNHLAAYLAACSKSHSDRNRSPHGLPGDEPLRSIHARYDPRSHGGYDVVILPLAYQGDRAPLESDPPAPHVFFHEWLPRRWFRRGPKSQRIRTRIISFALMKRLTRIDRAVPVPIDAADGLRSSPKAVACPPLSC